MGDFNYPGIDWNGTWSSVRDNDFIECVRDAYLFQMVRKPTRRREGQQPNILDLVLVNDENLVSDIEHLCPFGKSDHEVLYFNLYVNAWKPTQDEGNKFDFKKGLYDQMKTEFQQMSWITLHEMDVEESWLMIKSRILSSMEKYIPKVKIKQNKYRRPSNLNKKQLEKHTEAT